MVSLLVFKACSKCCAVKEVPAEQNFCEVCGGRLSGVGLKKAAEATAKEA